MYSEENILIPTNFIKGNEKDIINFSNKIFVAYIILRINENVYGESMISLWKIYNECGLKKPDRKNQTYQDVINILHYLNDNGFIYDCPDFDSVKFNEAIFVKINRKSILNYKGKLTAITPNQYSKIKKLASDNNVNFEKLLHTFLYISSYIGYDTKNESSIHAYWGTFGLACDNLDISRNVLFKYMKILSCTKDGVLIKAVTYVKKDDGEYDIFPNIYVLRNKFYYQEIDKAVAELSSKYGVEVKIKQIEK